MKNQELKKYIFTSVIGNGLEWYDFAIFGYFAPIFAKQFFPSTSAFVSLLSTFAVFAVGFLSRPLGAYLLGRMGDQHGRKQALLFSMLLMAISTSLMGFLPTYDTIGITAPLFLVVLRIFQGISIGGEFTGSLSFVVEHSPPSKRGFVAAVAYSGGFLGSVLGAGIGSLVTFFTSPEQLYDWGWRIPFIVGFAIAFFGYYLRQGIEETPAFLELQEKDQIDPTPLKSVSRENRTEMLQVIGILVPNSVWVYLFVFFPTYLVEVMGWNFCRSFVVSVVPPLFALLFVPLAGYLSDLYGRVRVILAGHLCLLILAPFVLRLVSEGVYLHIILIQVVVSFFFSLSCGPVAALLTEMFPIRVRNTGMAISYHVATGIFGGLTPLILTSLTSFLGMFLGPIVLISLSGVIGVLILFRIHQPGREVEC